MAEESAKLRIPYIAAAQAQKHVTHNEGMTLLDTLVQLSVLDKDLSAPPPGSPVEGDTYIVAAGASGGWIGWDKRIARFIDGTWRSYLPGEGDGAGWLAYVSDERAFYVFTGTAWERLFAVSLSIRNHVVNPSGSIAQITPGSTADAAYTGFDQWLALTQSNPVAASQLTDVEDGTPFAMRLTQSNASAQRFGLIQPIEKAMCRHLRGQAVTLSARVRISQSTKLRFAVLEWTGTADSIGSGKDVVNDWTSANFTTGNFFKSTTTTLVAAGSLDLTANTLADIGLSGAVSGSMNNLLVFLWTDSTQAQSVTLDISKVQLVRGTGATPFLPRPFDVEIALCQRYYEKSYNLGTAIGSNTDTGTKGGIAYSTVAVGSPFLWAAKKRSDPTVTLYSKTGTSGVWTVPGGTNTAAASASSPGENGFLVVVSSGLSVGGLVYGHWVADARL